MDRDYTHIFFGLVVFAGVIAMLLMVAPGGEQNRIGAAVDLADLAADDTNIQQYSFSQGTDVQVAGKTITRVEENVVAIDSKQRDITFETPYALDSRRTFLVKNDFLYVLDVWDSPTCGGIYGQTRITSPDSVCCGSVTSVPLPDCSAGDSSVQCGDKRIYCEDGLLKSEVNQ